MNDVAVAQRIVAWPSLSSYSVAVTIVFVPLRGVESCVAFSAPAVCFLVVGC
jgi:hypothetical protein